MLIESPKTPPKSYKAQTLEHHMRRRGKQEEELDLQTVQAALVSPALDPKCQSSRSQARKPKALALNRI